MRYSKEKIDRILEIGRRNKQNIDFSEAGISSRTGITICREHGVEINPISIDGLNPPIFWCDGYFEILSKIRFGELTIEEGQIKLKEIGVKASISSIKYKLRDEILKINSLMNNKYSDWREVKGGLNLIINKKGEVRTLWRFLKLDRGFYKFLIINEDGVEKYKRIKKEDLIKEIWGKQ